MSGAYIKGGAGPLHAQIVYDKFHVIQHVVESCDRVRKLESRLNAMSRERLEFTLWMWRKNPGT